MWCSEGTPAGQSGQESDPEYEQLMWDLPVMKERDEMRKERCSWQKK